MNNKWKSEVIKFLGAQTISLFGSSIVQYAIIWYITLTTSSGVMMTIATICGYLPQILISLFAGVWIDRHNRKYLIMLSDGMIACATICILLAFIMGVGNIWLLFIVLLVRSAGTGIQTPAVNALLPQLVPQEHLMRINGIQSTLTSLTMFLSPAVSGFVLSIMSIEATFFIDIITAILANLIMIWVRVNPIRVNNTSQTMLQGVKESFSYLKNHAFMKHQLMYLIMVMLFISPAAFLTPLLVSRSFGSEVWRLTASEMTFSIGAVCGGMLISLWGGYKNRMKTVMLMTAIYGFFMVGIGLSPIYLIYLVCNFLIGITMPCFNAPVNVSIQEQVEPSMQGRIFSLLQLANACSLPLGTILFGPLADFMNVQFIFLGTGCIVISIAAFAKLKKVFEVKG